MDQLFAGVERAHGPRPWGSVLDAGTGDHSLAWLLGLPTRRVVAVTGSPERSASMEKRFSGRLRPEDRLVHGNWLDPSLLHGERFDVVVADYLLGALDGFAPYYQEHLFARLLPHVGGRLYVIGQEPFPDQAEGEGARFLLEIARLRDANILLAGHRCYREYPRAWVEKNLERNGYVVEDAWSVPILFKERFINGQLDVCLSKLPLFKDRALADAMRLHVEDLRRRALAAVGQGIRFASDYVVVARPS